MRFFQYLPKIFATGFFLIALQLGAAPQAFPAAEPLVIDEAFEHAHLAGQVEYLVDAESKLSIEDVSNQARQWAPLPGKGAKRSFGYSRATFWFRFSVTNPADHPKTWMLEYDYPIVDYIDFFMADTGLHYKSGDHRPFDVRPVTYRTIVFPVITPPGVHECYIKLASRGSIVLPLHAWSKAAFETKKTRDLSLIWLYYGIMLALGIYNFFIFLFIRERSYLYLVLFTVSVTLFTMAHNGHAFQYLWPNATWWASACHPISVTLSALTVLMFTRRFLLIKEKAVNIDRIFIILIGCGVLLIFAALVVEYYYATQLSVLFAAVCAFIIVATSIMNFENYIRNFPGTKITWKIWSANGQLSLKPPIRNSKPLWHI